MDFRQLGECLDSETSNRLRDIGERYMAAQPGAAKRLEFENIARSGEEAAEAEAPAQLTDCASRQGGECATSPRWTPRSIATASHAAATQGRSPVPAVVIDLVVWKNERAHHAFSGTR